MSPEQQKQQHYLEEVLATVKSPGFKYLLEDWQKQLDSYSDVRHVQTVEQLYFQKGRVDQLDYLRGLEEMFEAAYEQFQRDLADGVADEY